MAKKSKLKTPDWITEGYDSPAEYNNDRGIKKKKKSGKIFKIRECPKCGSDDVGIVLVGEGGGKADSWECRKCKWKGREVEKKELTEDEMMEYLEKDIQEVFRKKIKEVFEEEEE